MIISHKIAYSRDGGGSISLSILRCCQKLLNGAIPVPGPTMTTGRVESSGRWKLGALKIKNIQLKISTFYLVCYKVTRYKVLYHPGTYILTTQGMVSPISHLFNQEEHTPSCTGPTPPAKINYTVGLCIKLYIPVLAFSDYPKILPLQDGVFYEDILKILK